MKDKLFDYFARIMPLSEEEVTALTETLRTEQYPKGHVLLKEGQVSAAAYFVLEGCVREYHIVDGEERITNFFTEEQWVTSLNTFGAGIPATNFMACCEDTTLVVGDRTREAEMYRRFPKFEAIAMKVLGGIFAEQHKMMASYFTDSPEERYMKLLETRPGLIQRIPQYMLASYIGVKPESLSRIRKRLSTK